MRQAPISHMSLRVVTFCSTAAFLRVSLVSIDLAGKQLLQQWLVWMRSWTRWCNALLIVGVRMSIETFQFVWVRALDRWVSDLKVD